MIKIGILSTSQVGVDSVQEIQQFKDFKITGILNLEEKDTGRTYATDDLLSSSDAISIDHAGEVSSDLLKSVLRKSVDVYLKKPFIKRLSEIAELISLQLEANCTVQICNPYLFQSDLLRMEEKANSLRLTEININISKNKNLEFELLQVLLYLSKTDNSGFRKTEVFALEGEQTFLLNLYVQFSSGSVAQVNLCMECDHTDLATFRIFQKNEVPSEINIKLTGEAQSKVEQNTLKEFLKGIKGKDATLLSLNELQQSIIALQKIKEKLKYLNIDLSD